MSATRATDGTLPIDAALRVVNADALGWARSCDVLVVGFGAAGAATAITARAGGAEVLITERFDGGGATARSGGVVYVGGGTPYQTEAGYQDTPEEMFRYLRQEVGEAVTEPTLRRFCDESRDLLTWLESVGARYESCAKPPKTSYPRDGIYLYYSGNEGVPAYAQHARPAPRGHRTKGSWMSGQALFEALRGHTETLGIPVLQQSAVRRLIVDNDGNVLGAEAWQLEPGSAAAQQHRKLMLRAEKFHNFAPAYADRLRVQARALEQTHARPQAIRARRGVVLTTGGFVFNREMMQQHAPRFFDNMRLGTTGCDGSGIRLGLSVGAGLDRMHKASAWRFINPPTVWPKGIVVNRQGQRFCNEQVYGAKLGVALCEDHEGRAWLILDQAQRAAAIREALFGKLWFFQSVPALLMMLTAPRGRSIPALARHLDMPADALQATVDDYNRRIQAGTTDALGKSDDMRLPLLTAPFYALDLSAKSKSPLPTITLGGLKVDENTSAVLDQSGRPIAGLYAAGRCAVGIASNGYVSGLSLADCLWSGRRAGHALTSA